MQRYHEREVLIVDIDYLSPEDEIMIDRFCVIQAMIDANNNDEINKILSQALEVMERRPNSSKIELGPIMKVADVKKAFPNYRKLPPLYCMVF